LSYSGKLYSDTFIKEKSGRIDKGSGEEEEEGEKQKVWRSK
jgi:hypothetical protein